MSPISDASASKTRVGEFLTGTIRLGLMSFNDNTSVLGLCEPISWQTIAVPCE